MNWRPLQYLPALLSSVKTIEKKKVSTWSPKIINTDCFMTEEQVSITFVFWPLDKKKVNLLGLFLLIAGILFKLA